MAKTAKVKKKLDGKSSPLEFSRALLRPTANPRSRAARRNASPSLDLDKSVTEAPRASDATPILAARPGSGIQKAKKKQKPMKRGQRARQEKGLARAEIVMDQLEQKKVGTQNKMNKVRGRRAIWDEINGDAKEEQRKAPKYMAFVEGAVSEDAENQEWEDVDEHGDEQMKTVDGAELPVIAGVSKLVVVDRTASNAGSDLDDIT